MSDINELITFTPYACGKCGAQHYRVPGDLDVQDGVATFEESDEKMRCMSCQDLSWGEVQETIVHPSVDRLRQLHAIAIAAQDATLAERDARIVDLEDHARALEQAVDHARALEQVVVDHVRALENQARALEQAVEDHVASAATMECRIDELCVYIDTALTGEK